MFESLSPVEFAIMTARDPNAAIDKASLPAITVLLHRVCDNDVQKYAEANRLIELIVEHAIKQHDARTTPIPTSTESEPSVPVHEIVDRYLAADRAYRQTTNGFVANKLPPHDDPRTVEFVAAHQALKDLATPKEPAHSEPPIDSYPDGYARKLTGATEGLLYALSLLSVFGRSVTSLDTKLSKAVSNAVVTLDSGRNP